MSPGNLCKVTLCGGTLLVGAVTVQASERETTRNPQPVYSGSRVLAHGDFVVELMAPNDPLRYNRGVRFTPLAGIIRATLGTNDFLFHEPEHDPLTATAGLFTEFDALTSPPGFDEAQIGEGFVKIGVGVLTKAATNYHFFPQYKPIQIPATEVTWGAETAEYHQLCAPYNGYGYELGAKVTVGDGTIVVDWRLKNMGSKPLKTEQYAHNCLRFNRQSVGPGYEVGFPYDFQARGLQKEQRQSERTIQFTEQIPKAVNINLDYPENYTGPNTLSLVHPASGLFVDCLTSARGLRTIIHAEEHYLCPEQLIVIELQPGEQATWQRQYKFGSGR